MGNIGQDISPEELRRQHSDAIRTIHEQRVTIEDLEKLVNLLRDGCEKMDRKVKRSHELYESSVAVVRRYQAERDGLLDRVRGALLGIKESSHDD